MSFTPGTRVLLTKSQTNFLLGTVVNTIANQIVVALDSRPFTPNTFIKLPANLAVPVDYFKLQNKQTKYESIKHDPNEDVHKLLLSKKNSKFDLAVVRSGWCWTNAHLFDFKLKHYPTFSRTDPFQSKERSPEEKRRLKNTLGIFFSGHPPTIVIRLEKMISIYECFVVTVHEMIHQINWEEGKIEPNAHGKEFLEWADAVQSVCKVPLRVMGDTVDQDVDFKKDDLNSEGEKKEFYVFMIVNGGKNWAIASKDLNVLERIRDVYAVRNPQNYLRKISNDRLRSILKFQNTFSKTIRGWKELPQSLVNLIVEEGVAVYSKQLVV